MKIIKKSNWVNTLSFVVAVITFNFTLIAQNEITNDQDWKLIKTQEKGEGWKIYKAKVPDSKLFQYKIVGKVNCSAENAQNTVMEMTVDPNMRINKRGKSLGWIEVLERTENEIVVYDFMKGNFMIKDRDVVVRYSLFRDSTKNVKGVKWNQIDYEGYEATDSIIRMPIATGSWSFKEIDSTSCIATEIFQFHPGGKIPAWMVNMVARSTIHIELEHLRNSIKIDY